MAVLGHRRWIQAPYPSFDPNTAALYAPKRGRAGRVAALVGALSQQQLLDLEKLHAAEAERAEVEDRWADAAREWDLAAAHSSQYASGAGPVERDAVHLRFKEYRRREEVAKLRAAAPRSSALGTAILVGSAGALLYFVSPGLALGAVAGIWSGAKRAGSYVAGKAKGAVT